MFRIGTSGYSFKDWVGPVYPRGLRSSDYLPFYEKDLGFNTVEVNYTYYRPPTAKTLESMSRKTSDSFEFIIKAYKDMTHVLERGQKKIQPKINVFHDFTEALAPLKESGKLGGVLAQFPYSFHADRPSAEYIVEFRELMGDLPVFIEFRNSEWMQDKTFDFLKKYGLGYCAVDEPPLKGLVPFKEAVTASAGYVRLHGRNKKWFEADMAERYNYNYSKEELKDLSAKILRVHQQTKKTFIFFNNCHQGFAAKNAREMISMLSEAQGSEQRYL
jgi:uncharacterized protein YecE (DUF72 family)